MAFSLNFHRNVVGRVMILGERDKGDIPPLEEKCRICDLLASGSTQNNSNQPCSLPRVVITP